jgi:hypothetical protein
MAMVPPTLPIFAQTGGGGHAEFWRKVAEEIHAMKPGEK